MKNILIGALVFLSFHGMGNTGFIQEEVFVNGLQDLKIIKQHPALTIDHMTNSGFELYGPKGMKQWLQESAISFSENTHSHSHSTKSNKFEVSYPTYEQIEANLLKLVALRPDIAKLFSIGKSTEGRELYVVKISDNVEIDELEPEFKYISSMHGNEITGRELTQFLIKDIIEGYGSNQQITELVNNTELYIMPSMNPDGSKRKQRANAKGYDLNRNFPDWTIGEINSEATRQAETKAVMKFQASRNFSLSANFHGGAVVANYPWDSTYERHPFDKLLQDISLKYANENPEMRTSTEFAGGITNGADWYVLKGGMQDWSYFWYNDLQITVELSNQKWPRYSKIPGFYQDNKASMLTYAEAIHQGAGFVTSSKIATGSVEVMLKLNDGSYRALGSFGFSRGEFYKVLTNGEYKFRVNIKGENTVREFTTTVDPSVQANGNYTALN